jgi:hypothetical protein
MTEQKIVGETKTFQSKRDFFEQLAFSHLPEMRLLFRGGKLWKKDKWRNAPEHCLAQIVIADELPDLIGLSSEEKTDLIKVAACHDWAKRLERRPDDFTKEEKERAQIFLRRVNPKQNLLEATGPDFLKKFLKGVSTFLERLQCYIDDITLESEIVEYDNRLNETKKRYPELDDIFWKNQREFDKQVSQEIFEKLAPDVRAEIGEPKNIPNYLRQQIEKKWRQ